MEKVRIIFGGGGDEIDSRPLDEQFARWVGKGKLLYLPTALIDPASMQAGISWLRSTFQPLGLVNIEVWNDLAGKTAADLNGFDAVYIGGGNTFYLLHQLRIHHLIRPLKDFIQAGHPAYGGSAGAIVLCKTITPCAHIDTDIVGLRDRQALDLALGWNIWCHYTPADADRIAGYVRRTRVLSAAASERSGVYREGDHLYAAGQEPVMVFTRSEVKTVQPGDRIT